MADLDGTQITQRLARLGEDLDRFPAGATCPWALARVFNELVKLAKRDLADDPIVRALRLLEEGLEETPSATSNASVGTVRALIGQIMVAYEGSAGAVSGTKEPKATTKRASSEG